MAAMSSDPPLKVSELLGSLKIPGGRGGWGARERVTIVLPWEELFLGLEMSARVGAMVGMGGERGVFWMGEEPRRFRVGN